MGQRAKASSTLSPTVLIVRTNLPHPSPPGPYVSKQLVTTLILGPEKTLDFFFGPLLYGQLDAYLMRLSFSLATASIFAWTRGLKHRAKLDGEWFLV